MSEAAQSRLLSPDGHPCFRDNILPHVTVAIVFLVSIIYVTYGTNRSIWLDEATSVLIAQQPLRGIVSDLSRDGNPPLYYFLLDITTHIAGNSELAVRLPSVISYILAVFAMYHLIVKLYNNHRAAAFAAALYAISPIAGTQAQNVRMYSMLGLITILATMAFAVLAWDGGHNIASIFAHSALTVVGLLTHYWFAFVLLGQWMWVVCTIKRWTGRRLLLLAAADTLPFSILWLPVFLQQLTLPTASWHLRPRLRELLESVTANIGIFPLSRTSAIIIVVLSIVGGVALAIKWRRKDHVAIDERSVFLVVSLICTLCVPFTISQVRPIFWPGRYTIVSLPFLAALFGVVLSHLRPAMALVVICIAGISSGQYFVRKVWEAKLTQILMLPDPVPLGDRPAGQYICTSARPGDIVVYTSLSRAAVEYYLQRCGIAPHLVQISYPHEFGSHLGWLDWKRRYVDEPAFQAEADALLREVRDLMSRSDRTLFLLRGSDSGPFKAFSGTALGDFLTAKLERVCPAVNTKRFMGSFFSEIRVYRYGNTAECRK